MFRHGESVLATSAQCPHAGGPLHLGDIEVKRYIHQRRLKPVLQVLPDRSVCLSCPWHKWTFNLGQQVSTCIQPQPQSRKTLFQEKPGQIQADFDKQQKRHKEHRRLGVTRANPNSGTCVRPQGHLSLKLETFPVRKHGRATLKIGFQSMDANILMDEQF